MKHETQRQGFANEIETREIETRLDTIDTRKMNIRTRCNQETRHQRLQEQPMLQFLASENFHGPARI